MIAPMYDPELRREILSCPLDLSDPKECALCEAYREARDVFGKAHRAYLANSLDDDAFAAEQAANRDVERAENRLTEYRAERFAQQATEEQEDMDTDVAEFARGFLR